MLSIKRGIKLIARWDEILEGEASVLHVKD